MVTTIIRNSGERSRRYSSGSALVLLKPFLLIVLPSQACSYLTRATNMFYAAIFLCAVLVRTQVLTPPGSSPAGCVSDVVGNYEVTVVNPDAGQFRRSGVCGTGGLIVALTNSILTDDQGRIGSIVANHELQFDDPPAQTDTIYTGGFSFCPNSSIAFGRTTNFYQCLNGSTVNLYDQPQENNCQLVNLIVKPCFDSGSFITTSSTSLLINTFMSAAETTRLSVTESASSGTTSSRFVTNSPGSSSSTASATSTSTNSGSSSIASSSFSPMSTASTLSDSAKLGIGVGVGIAAVLMFSLAAFMFGRRQRQKGILLSGTPSEYARQKGMADKMEPGLTVSDEPGVAVY